MAVPNAQGSTLRRLAPTLLALAAIGPALARCVRDLRPRESAPPPHAPIRLLERLRPDSVTRPAVATAGEEARERSFLFVDDFDGIPAPGGSGGWQLAPEWLSLAPPPLEDDDAEDASQPRIVKVDDGLRAALVPPFSATGLTRSAGIRRDLELAPYEWALVRARVRPVAPAQRGGELAALPLRTFAGSLHPERLRNAVLQVGPRPSEGESLAARPADELGPGWLWLERLVRAQPLRQGLRVQVTPGDAALLIDRIEVVRSTLMDALLAAPRAPDDASELPWRRIVRFAGRRCDALLLAGGTCARIEVEVPARRPRIELLLSSTDPHEAPPRTLTLRVDGETIATRAADGRDVGGEREFVRLVAPLERFAGRRATVELLASGEETGGLVVGAPCVLFASDDAARRPPGLVVISIDTLRADHVGCYGSDGGWTPAIDALAAAGTRFSRMQAISPWTLPSHASLLTSQHPIVHGAHRDDLQIETGRSVLLSEVLRDAGYATAAFTGGGFFDPAFGFGVGFDHYSILDPGDFADDRGRPAGDPLAPAIDWLREHADAPFFLLLHTYAVHDYAPLAQEFERWFPDAGATPSQEEVRRMRIAATRGDRGPIGLMRRLYAAALRQTDEHLVRRLLDELDSLGLAASTVVALVSDHGEQFFEHGAAFHGDWLWNEVSDVPWILRGPGVDAGAVIDSPVSHVDVAPTLLARLGRAIPPAMHGRDALATRPGESEPPLLLHCETSALRMHALLLDGWKLIRRRTADGVELSLFDLRRDPRELDDRAASEPGRVADLERRLDQEIALREELARSLATGRVRGLERPEGLDERLRALGYLGDGE